MLIIAAFLALSLVVALKAMPKRTARTPDLNALVSAIRQVENWDGRSRGAAGERGPWQITPEVWLEHSTRPFWWAEARTTAALAESRRVALQHLGYLTRRLEYSGLVPSVYLLALSYCSGPTAVINGRPRRPGAAKRDYARRARNLYEEILKNTTPPETHAGR